MHEWRVGCTNWHLQCILQGKAMKETPIYIHHTPATSGSSPKIYPQSSPTPHFRVIFEYTVIQTEIC